MSYAMFRCCVTNKSLQAYEAAADEVVNALNIKAIDIREFGCCGYPLRNVDYKASMYSAARNFALAGKAGRDLLTVCNCCFGSLKQAKLLLSRDEALMQEVPSKLAAEGLEHAPEVKVKHLLEVLYHDLGPNNLAQAFSQSLQGLKVVMHYGCHLLRPSNVLDFDNPFDPSICEELVTATGAECLDWEKRLDCCGAPLGGIFDDLANSMAEQKLEAASQSGAHCLLAVCPFCQLQLNRVAQAMSERGQTTPPVFSITQLFTAALGKDSELRKLSAMSR